MNMHGKNNMQQNAATRFSFTRENNLISGAMVISIALLIIGVILLNVAVVGVLIVLASVIISKNKINLFANFDWR